MTGLNVDTAYSVSVTLANNNGSGPNSTAVEEETPPSGGERNLLNFFYHSSLSFLSLPQHHQSVK